MPSARSSRDGLQSPIPKKKHRTGRYIAVGAFLIVTLLTLHHVLLRDASKIAGIFVPTIIMGCYILWIAYSARRDKLKVRRRRAALAMQLTEVITNQPPTSKSTSTSTSAAPAGKGKGGSGGATKGAAVRTPQETPGVTVKHNTVLTSVQERPVILSRGDSDDNKNPGSEKSSADMRVVRFSQVISYASVPSYYYRPSTAELEKTTNKNNRNNGRKRTKTGEKKKRS